MKRERNRTLRVYCNMVSGEVCNYYDTFVDGAVDRETAFISMMDEPVAVGKTAALARAALVAKIRACAKDILSDEYTFED